MAGDFVPSKQLKVYVQSNGIIRLASNGLYVGKLDGMEYEQLGLLDQVSKKIMKENEEDKLGCPYCGNKGIHYCQGPRTTTEY